MEADNKPLKSVEFDGLGCAVAFGIFILILAGIVFGAYFLISKHGNKAAGGPTAIASASSAAYNDYNGIEITGLAINKNMLNQNEVYPKVVNHTAYTLDAVTFLVECEDIYGEKLRESDAGGYDAVITEEQTVQPGKGFPKQVFCTLSGFDRADMFYIAVMKYHTKDGRTIEIPEEDRVWNSYKQNN